MKRNHTPKVQSLDSAIQNVALLADHTWLFDECYNDEFKQKNLELWIDFKETEELAKSNQNTFTTQSRLADHKHFNHTSCDQKQEYPHEINQVSNNPDENFTGSTYDCHLFSENVNRIYERLTQPLPERLHSKMKFAQPMSSPPLPPPTSKPETECNYSASSKKWLSALPWPSLLIKNFPALPEIIPDENSFYVEEKPKRRNESDLKKYPPPHYSIKTSEEFKLHMVITSRKVKEIWDDFPPSTGKTLEDIFESQNPRTPVELDCEIPEFYPRSWQVLSNSCKPISNDDQERTSQSSGYLTGCRSQVNPQCLLGGLPIQEMETNYYDYSFGIVNQEKRRVEPNNFIKMVEYSGWPVIDERALNEMNASVARLYPEHEELFYDMISVVDNVYNFFEDDFITQNNTNDNQLACYPVIHSEESRDEENTFDQLEKEALEQYQGSDHQLMTVQHSDESIAKKFQDLEQQAMEQYNTNEILQEEEEEEEEEEESGEESRPGDLS
ncbi:hypothetical protein LSTR_LSTR010165 [Laodelphax striatellus]|uniref:Uncharacterized protein n=1 Tax=Laodelphax striatellus TaxID=195883 RepID=A0A482WIZ7_LAOST|nr:hypothetical protein LSTR_LSTR010165 [Laodelphax striatellus]